MELEPSQKEQPVSENEMSSAPIDGSVLRTLRELQIEGQPDILARIIGAYLKSSEPLIAELQKALVADNIEELQNAAHSLKSSSANVGAMGLSEFNKELEMCCRNNTLEMAADLVAAIDAEFLCVKDALNREINAA